MVFYFNKNIEIILTKKIIFETFVLFLLAKAQIFDFATLNLCNLAAQQLVN